jgi:hypothetical protein
MRLAQVKEKKSYLGFITLFEHYQPSVKFENAMTNGCNPMAI